MSVTIALRAKAVLPAVIVLGAVACSYEYDRFKVEPPNATAGKDGTTLPSAGTSGKASNGGNGGKASGGAKASVVFGGAGGSTSVHSNSGGLSTASGGISGAGASPNNSGGHSTAPESTGGRSNTSSWGTKGGTGPGATTTRPTTGGATGTSAAGAGGTSIRSVGGAHSGGVSGATSGGASSSVGAAGTSSTCQAPLVACSGSCVDLTNSPDHCGACGHACFQASASWAVCVTERCSCDGGSTLCNAGMVCEKKDACTASPE